MPEPAKKEPGAAGKVYSELFENNLRSVVNQKFDEAKNSWIKGSAMKALGIKTLKNAQDQNKAPSERQIEEATRRVVEICDKAYGDRDFRHDREAHNKLVDALTQGVRELNKKWEKAGQYAFEEKDLIAIEQKAREIVTPEEHRKTLQKTSPAKQDLSQNQKLNGAIATMETIPLDHTNSAPRVAPNPLTKSQGQNIG